MQPTVVYKKGSTTRGSTCCVDTASLITLLKGCTSGEVLLPNYRPLCRKHFNSCTLQTLWSMNILHAQYHREGAAAAWKFPWDTVAPAREFGMLRMCILCIYMRALYPRVNKVSHARFRIYIRNGFIYQLNFRNKTSMLGGEAEQLRKGLQPQIWL